MVAESAVHGVGIGGVFGAGEGWAVTVASMCAEGKLADEEDFAADVVDGEIHFVVVVGEDPQFDDFRGERLDVAIGVAFFDAQEDEKTSSDGRDLVSRDGDRCAADALNNSFHGILSENCVSFARSTKLE